MKNVTLALRIITCPIVFGFMCAVCGTIGVGLACVILLISIIDFISNGDDWKEGLEFLIAIPVAPFAATIIYVIHGFKPQEHPQISTMRGRVTIQSPLKNPTTF